MSATPNKKSSLGARFSEEARSNEKSSFSASQTPKEQRTPMSSADSRSLSSFLQLSREEKQKLTATPGKSFRKMLKYQLEDLPSPDADYTAEIPSPHDYMIGDDEVYGRSDDLFDQYSSPISEQNSSNSDTSVQSDNKFLDSFGNRAMGKTAEIIAMKAMLKVKEKAMTEQAVEITRQVEVLQHHHEQKCGKLVFDAIERWMYSGVRKAFRCWVISNNVIHHIEILKKNFQKEASEIKSLGKEECLGKVLLRLRQRHVVSCWKSLVIQRDEKYTRYVHQLLMHIERTLRRAIQQWRFNAMSAVADTRRAEITLQVWAKFSPLLNRHSKGRALAKWLKLVQSDRRRRSILYAAAVVLGKKCSVACEAFFRWRKYSGALPPHRVMLLATLEKYTFGLRNQTQICALHSAFLSWRRKVMELTEHLQSCHKGLRQVAHLLCSTAHRSALRAFRKWSLQSVLCVRAISHLFATMQLLFIRSDRGRMMRGLTVWKSICVEKWDNVLLHNRITTAHAMLVERGEKAARVLFEVKTKASRKRVLANVVHALRLHSFQCSTGRSLFLTRFIARFLDDSLSSNIARSRLQYTVYRWLAITIKTRLVVEASQVILRIVGTKRQRAGWTKWNAVLRNTRFAARLKRMFHYCEKKQKFSQWRSRSTRRAQEEYVLSRLSRRVYIYLLRWWMRRWSYKLAIARLTVRQKNFLAQYIPMWRNYSRLMRLRRVRLRYTIHMTRIVSLRIGFRQWSYRSKRDMQLIRCCHTVRRYFQRVPKTLLRMALAQWRSSSSLRRIGTMQRIGEGLTMALRRIIDAEHDREEEVMNSSLLSSQIDELRAYARSLIQQSVKSLEYRRCVRLLRLCMREWIGYKTRKSHRKRVLERLLRSMQRNSRRVALAQRFSQWRRQSVKLISSQRQALMLRRKLSIAGRRYRYSILSRVIKCWRSRLGCRFRLLRSLKGIKLAALRRHCAKAFYRWRAALLRDLTKYRTTQRIWFQRLVNWSTVKRSKRLLAGQRIKSILRDKRRCLKMRVLHAWCQESNRQNRQKRMFSHVLSLTRRACCVTTFRKWAKLRSEKQRLRKFLSADAILRRKRLDHCMRLFSHWKIVSLRDRFECTIRTGLMTRRKWACDFVHRTFYRRPLLSSALSRWKKRSLQARLRGDFQLQTGLAIIQRRVHNGALRRSLLAWRRAPGFDVNRSMRLHGYPLLAHSIPIAQYWVSALHAEAAGHRNWHTSIEILCDALAEALPTFQPSVFILKEIQLLVGLEKTDVSTHSTEAVGLTDGFVEKRLLLGEGAVGRCAESGQALMIRSKPVRPDDARLIEALILPVLWHNACVGVIQLTSKESLPASTAGKKVRFQEDGEQERGSRLSGALAVPTFDLSRFHDQQMLEAPHEEGSLPMAKVLFASLLTAKIPLLSCMMIAPIIFTAAEIFHLHYAVSVSSEDASSTKLHTDPSLGETLQKLEQAVAMQNALRDRLHETEKRTALMIHELEHTNALTASLCNQRIARLEASRDKYRAKVLEFHQPGTVGGKENLAP